MANWGSVGCHDSIYQTDRMFITNPARRGQNVDEDNARGNLVGLPSLLFVASGTVVHGPKSTREGSRYG